MDAAADPDFLSPPTLAALLGEANAARLLSGNPETRIGGIAFDSRRVNPGELFVAVPGFKRDGREFIGQAVEKGAVAIASEAPVPLAAAARIEVPSARAALADFAASYYGHPSRHLTLIGVTGTDGKTSTIQLLSAVLETAGHRTGWLTTVDLKLGAERQPNDFLQTTPEAVAIQSLLRQLVDGGVDIGLLEVSSHALWLDRVRGCEFDLAVFTNLSPEHLNFHGTLEAYREAKSRLFRTLDSPRTKHQPRWGIVNADDPASATMRSACSAPIVTYGLEHRADVVARDVQLTARGSSFRLVTPSGQCPVSTRLLGRFNVVNWLAAAAAAHAMGIGPEVVARAAASLPPVRGRMEPVERSQPFVVIVDFAHTPQALSNALRTLREHTSGRLMLVFGNAGERDPASRPAMGQLAAQLSDFFVITMDDPLDEDPAEIAEQTARAAERAGAKRGESFTIELDRRRAIRLVLERAHAGDAVLLAGKGHEARMLVGSQRLPWSDRQAAEEVLNRAHL